MQYVAVVPLIGPVVPSLLPRMWLAHLHASGGTTTPSGSTAPSSGNTACAGLWAENSWICPPTI